MSTGSPWFLRARLKTRQLMLLVAIEEQGNIHRAAEVLNMSQPAASKLLKDLEDMLGVSLFERLPRGTRPTWYGEAMTRHARMALACLTEAGAEIEHLKAGHFGKVAVGAISGAAMTLLPPVVARVTGDQPGLRIALTVDSSDVLLEQLSQNRLDFLVARLFERHDKTHLHYQALAEEQVCAIARPDHPILQRRNLTLEDLVELGWIVPPSGSVLRHRFELMFQEASLEAPQRLIESAALVFVTRMLQQGDDLAVVPTDVARYYAEHGMVAMVPITLACTMDAFGIITRTDWLLSPAARVVLDALRETASELYGLSLAPATPRRGKRTAET